MSKFARPQLSPPTPGALIIFLLGPPCAGKSIFSAHLTTTHSLTHLSLGAELRSLTSPIPTGPTALLKAHFTPSELALFTANVSAGTLAPPYLTPKYIRARIFPEGVDASSVRVLVDGFPRDVERWKVFKDVVEGVWKPGRGTLVLVLRIEREVARERFLRRGREGDVLEKRFDEYEREIGGIMEAMRRDGVGVVEVQGGEDVGVEEIVMQLETNEEWVRVMGAQSSTGSE